MSPHLVFRVENLGPISNGEVELRPLTLLIGKNNTGKTYMAQAIHAAHKATERSMPVRTHLLDLSELADLESTIFSEEVKSDQVLPPPVLATAQTWVDGRFRNASRLLRNRMHNYHRVNSLNDLRSWGTEEQCQVSVYSDGEDRTQHIFGTSDKPSRVQVPEPSDIPDRGRGMPATAELRASLQNAILRAQRPPKQPFGRSEESDLSDVRDRARRSVSWTLSERLWQYTLRHSGFGNTSYYLPAGRSGLLLACTDIIRTRLQLDFENFGPEDGQRRMAHGDSLSGVASEFLYYFQGLFSDSLRFRIRRRSRRADLGLALELFEIAMGGSIHIDSQSNDVPLVIYQQADNRIPVERASSMVTELSPLAIWAREFIAPGDLLIVDEPEAHLHPEAIRLVARALVRLANAGVKVLCATHSSVLIHQVSNCMLAATVPDKDVGLLPEDRISLSNLGVFLFKRASSNCGVQVTSVKIDPVWGIPEEEYIEIADGLIDQAARIVRATQT